MQEWFGSAGLCINENGEILMVLQGKPEEDKTWSIPSGERGENETYGECCVREINEETGYIAEVLDKIKIKKGVYEEVNISFEVHYFLAKIVAGERKIQDPDHLIYDIAWKNSDELKELKLSFPEDRDFLIDYIKSKSHSQLHLD